MSWLDTLNFDAAYRLAKQDSLALIHKLQEAGVLYKSIDCHGCLSPMRLTKRSSHGLDGYTWQCYVKTCKKRTSIRKDSWFAKGHLSIGTQFLLLFCLFKYGKMLSKYIADIAGVHVSTMVDWENYARESISHYFLANPLVLGKDHAVQVDESLFGGKCKYHRGSHGIHKQHWVFGILEEETGLNVLWQVDDRTRPTLTSIIKEHVCIGATIKSDEWASYKALNEEGYIHLTVNHSVNFVSPSGVHTQAIESLWSHVKSIFKIRKGTHKDKLAGYLDLYSFRSLAKHRKLSVLRCFLEDVIQVNKVY